MRSTRNRLSLVSALAAALVMTAGMTSAMADKKKPAPAPAPAGDAKPADDGGEIEMGGDETDTKPADGGEIEMDGTEQEPAKDLASDIAASDKANEPTKVDSGTAAKTPVSWKDIVVVIRKPFLKLKRFEVMPMTTTSMNDNMIRHYGFGAQFTRYLTDVLAVGVEGQYYIHQFREPFDLVARQARRLPTVNAYNWSAALNFHYVPVYGKFAVLDKHLVTWEAFFTAGIGVTQSEVIPRDTKFPGFTNILITPNVGASMRFFLFKWLTVDLGVRDYIFVDKFEPANRDAMHNATADQAKDNADSSLINNVMFQFGVSFWFPTGFEYTTFR